MSHKFLSEEWIQAVREIRHRHAESIPAVTTSVRINIVTTQVPFGEGEVRAYIDTSSGTLDMEIGQVESAELTITTDYDTAHQLFVLQDPAASMQAFMSGRIKVDGDITRLMMMQAAMPTTESAIAVAEEIKAVTLH